MSVNDTVAPLPSRQAEVDRDRDALARAAIRAYAVRQPAREHDEHAGAAAASALRLRRARRRRAPETSGYGAYITGATPLRVADLELAAERRRVGADCRRRRRSRLPTTARRDACGTGCRGPDG